MKDNEAWLMQQLWEFFIEMESAKSDENGIELPKQIVENNQDQAVTTYCDKIINWL